MHNSLTGNQPEVPGEMNAGSSAVSMQDTALPIYPHLDKIFTYHAPKDDQPLRYNKLREKARQMAYLIEELCPDSREKSLAITKLQEVMMFANASIAINE